MTLKGTFQPEPLYKFYCVNGISECVVYHMDKCFQCWIPDSKMSCVFMESLNIPCDHTLKDCDLVFLNVPSSFLASQ